MLPEFVVQDFGAGRLRNAEFFGDIFNSPTVFPQAAHSEHIVLGELGIWCFSPPEVVDAKYAVAMQVIFAWRRIFQILKAIVIFLAVPVIDLVTQRYWANKSGENYTMHSQVMPFLVCIKKYTDISAFLFSALEGTLKRFVFSAISPIGDASHMASITDFIYSFKSDYGFPVFHGITIARLGLAHYA